MKNLKILVALVFFIQSEVSSQVFIGETEVDTATIISGLDIPWEIQWGPDNMIWTTERFGRISRIDPETGAQDVILDISDIVYQSGEAGLLGLVLHTDFENHPYVYTAYTYKPASTILERIVRFEYNGSKLVNEYVVIDNIQGNTTHDGCRLIILPDNTLLITTGDAQNQPAAQDLENLSGKVLRLNLDGSIPSDNPFTGNPVYSFGHRNAQGLYLAPNGIVYSSEHGPSTDDELNIIEPGRNYGWPNVHGYCDSQEEQVFCEANDVFEPLIAWTPTIATSDIIYYSHASIPEWQDKILLTSLKNKKLYELALSEDGTQVIGEEQYFFNWWGRLRDICMAPDGSIYLATNGPDWGNSEPFTHKIVKIWNPDYVSTNEQIVKQEDMFHTYPNPVKNTLYISIDQQFIGNDLNIFSSDGKLLYQQQLNDTFTKIPVDSINKGVIIVTIENENQLLFSEKLIISH